MNGFPAVRLRRLRATEALRRMTDLSPLERRERQSNAAELCTVADLASPAPHVIANALHRRVRLWRRRPVGAA